MIRTIMALMLVLGIAVIESQSMENNYYQADRICVDGYEYVVVRHGYSISIEQSYERNTTNYSNPVPKKCDWGRK